jgi:hypothetical protein
MARTGSRFQNRKSDTENHKQGAENQRIIFYNREDPPSVHHHTLINIHKKNTPEKKTTMKATSTEPKMIVILPSAIPYLPYISPCFFAFPPVIIDIIPKHKEEKIKRKFTDTKCMYVNSKKLFIIPGKNIINNPMIPKIIDAIPTFECLLLSIIFFVISMKIL